MEQALRWEPCASPSSVPACQCQAEGVPPLQLTLACEVLVGAHVDVHGEDMLLLQGGMPAAHSAVVPSRADHLVSTTARIEIT